MKFKSGLFLIGLMAVIGHVGNAYADKSCPADWYLLRFTPREGSIPQQKSCKKCPAGCYCEYPGNGIDREILDTEKTIYETDVAAWCARKKDTCAYGEDSINGGKQCGNSDAAGVFRCPDEFPGSVDGTKYLSSCYRYFGEKRVFYRELKCPEDQYLPMQSDQCVVCPPGYNCPGGTFRASANKNQGLGDDNNSGTTKCESGKYLPKGKTKCESCPSGFVPTGDGTNCEITIDAGYFVSTNTNQKSLCSNNNKVDSKHYCPGGTFKMGESANLGIVECPYGGTSDDWHTGCRLELTADQMKFGVSGAKSGKKDTKCWWYTDLTEFKDCVFGTKSSRKGELIYTRGSGTSVDASKMTISEADFTGAAATFAPSPRQ